MTKSNLLTGPIDFCYKLLWTVLNINLKIINEFYCVAVSTRIKSNFILCLYTFAHLTWTSAFVI